MVSGNQKYAKRVAVRNPRYGDRTVLVPGRKRHSNLGTITAQEAEAVVRYSKTVAAHNRAAELRATGQPPDLVVDVDLLVGMVRHGSL